MNTKKPVVKESKVKKAASTKKFATTKEANKAIDKAMDKYADAIKRLANR